MTMKEIQFAASVTPAQRAAFLAGLDPAADAAVRAMSPAEREVPSGFW